MSRFYVKPGSVEGGKIIVDKEESHHIIGVMRLKEGDLITVFDGTGREFDGRIGSIANKRVAIDVIETRNVSKNKAIEVTLAQAMPKKDKMDLIVQKATELGVRRIIPLESSRTVVRPKGEKRHKKEERWRKISVEASKQSGRTELPDIGAITTFTDVLDTVKDHDIAVMPCLSNRTDGFRQVLQKADNPSTALLIIGPEGGFSAGEIDLAFSKGVSLVDMGPLVLKSDTAAIAAVSVLNYEFMSK